MAARITIALVLLSLYGSFGFNPFPLSRRQTSFNTGQSASKNQNNSPKVNEVPLSIPLGDGYKSYDHSFRPIFANSEFLVITYDVPFELSIEKPPKGFPAPIVTKAGKRGEIEGDVLRATTCWSQGFNAAGATSDIAMFAGNIKWRKSVFDATGAPWDQVVQALVSNTEERSKTVTLVFEREIEEKIKIWN